MGGKEMIIGFFPKRKKEMKQFVPIINSKNFKTLKEVDIMEYIKLIKCIKSKSKTIQIKNRRNRK
jgi:hypothetical protein